MISSRYVTGHFGKVYLARLKADDFLLVLKCIPKQSLVSEGGEHQVRREIEVSLPVMVDKASCNANWRSLVDTPQIMQNLRYG